MYGYVVTAVPVAAYEELVNLDIPKRRRQSIFITMSSSRAAVHCAVRTIHRNAESDLTTLTSGRYRSIERVDRRKWCLLSKYAFRALKRLAASYSDGSGCQMIEAFVPFYVQFCRLSVACPSWKIPMMARGGECQLLEVFSVCLS